MTTQGVGAAQTAARLLRVPELGSSPALFERQRAAFPQLEVPPWLPTRRRESLRDYAARMADTIDPAGPMILGGVSIGGMLAIEMAQRIRPGCVLLIASCRTPRALHWYLHIAARVSASVPVGLMERGRALGIASTGWLLGPIGFSEKRVIA